MRQRSPLGVFLFFVLIIVNILWLPSVVVGGDDLDNELEKTSQEIRQAAEEKETTEEKIEEVQAQEEQLVGSINYYEYQLSLAQQRLRKLDADIDEKKRAIDKNKQALKEKELDLAEQREKLYKQVRVLYKTSFTDPLEVYFRSSDLEGARLAVFHQAIIENIRLRVYSLTEQIDDLGKKQEGLEKELKSLREDKDLLLEERRQVQENIVVSEKKVLAARAEQQQLMQQLAGLSKRLQELTRKEQEILAKKAAAALASTSVGEIEITRAAIASSPPQDGNVYFSFWTYGYPHRVGMNQYGAYGRAKAGQDFRQILGAYYQGVEIKKLKMPETIKIVDNGEVRDVPFEDDYLLGIGEMPSCWGTEENKGLEALKAQVVAARSYALKYTNWGESPICIDQKCQVYVGKSKISKLCGSYWERAVRETEGLVLTFGGEAISAWYASTAGGYTLSAKTVWGSDVSYAQGIKDADSNGDFYDGPKWGNSPWFHKAWGDGPWLSREQVEDLLNASLLPASYDAHLPLVKNDGFTSEEVLSTLQKEGISPIVNLKSLEVIGEETASTLLVRVYYGQTYTDIDAQRFRFVFNLRSPGTDAIWTSRFDIVTSVVWQK